MSCLTMSYVCTFYGHQCYVDHVVKLWLSFQLSFLLSYVRTYLLTYSLNTTAYFTQNPSSFWTRMFALKAENDKTFKMYGEF